MRLFDVQGGKEGLLVIASETGVKEEAKAESVEAEERMSVSDLEATTGTSFQHLTSFMESLESRVAAYEKEHREIVAAVEGVRSKVTEWEGKLKLNPDTKAAETAPRMMEEKPKARVKESLTSKQQGIMDGLVLNFDSVAFYGELRAETGLNDKLLTEALKELEKLGYVEKSLMKPLGGLGDALNAMEPKAKGFWERKGLSKLLKCDGRRPLYFATEKGEMDVLYRWESDLTSGSPQERTT